MIIIFGAILATIAALAFSMRGKDGSVVADGSSNGNDPSNIPEDIGVEAANQLDTRIILFSRAIAFAEGFGHTGNIPTRYHNPGDLKPPDGTGAYFTGQTGVGDGGHAIFANDAAGWNALYRQVRFMANNLSAIYNTRMTITKVAAKYAEDSKNWAKNVAQFLGVSEEITLQEFFYG